MLRPCGHGRVCAGTSQSSVSKGNCVRSSFSLHLIGLVFLDLGSRSRDQPLISCFWQLSLCLLFIGQSRMDHVTRHIFTCCPGMWEDTQVDTQTDGEKCLTKAAAKLFVRAPHHSPSLIFSVTQRLPVCQQSFLVIVKGGHHGNAQSSQTAATWALSASPSFKALPQDGCLAILRTSAARVSTFSSAPLITLT